MKHLFQNTHYMQVVILMN
ncbi:hypothetical protein PR048_000765 [Dryococelus australis]|uniref:Uncharacterized protein n=1 Tax=Dryococelus australis TaxID=614101 RepID=A0ABQ9IHX1_9NEOP|nr:hypothetical protein PR048_000765 [Dryococelus australis]